jgi:hypothetical protein
MPERDSPPSTPRWVKVFGIIVIVLILLLIIHRLTGIGGNHGPGWRKQQERGKESVDE